MKEENTAKIPWGKRELAIVGAILLVAFIVRLLLFSSQGYKIDTDCFQSWFMRAAEVGPRTFYNGIWSDYPPLNIYFFWIFGSLARSFSSIPFLYIMKLPANLLDMGTAFIIFAFLRKRFSFKMAILATALYAFNPAVIFDAAVWGQMDAIYTFFLVLSLVLAFEYKPKLAAVAFALAILTKPQSIALAPAIAFLIFRNHNIKALLVSVGVAVATIFAFILPFEWSNPLSFLYNIYLGAYSTPSYQVTTLNAFNIWAFGGMWVPDTVGFPTANMLGWLMFGGLTAFVLYFLYNKSKMDKSNYEYHVIFASFVLFFGFFMVLTRIHERYLFPAMALLVLMLPFVKRMRHIFAVLTATLFVNLAYVLSALRAAYPYGADLTGDPVVLIVSLINSLAFAYVLVLMMGELLGKKWLSPAAPVVEAAKEQEKTDNAVEQA